ncbi:MAG: hypothetical protein HYR60_28875 [Acidobacteria bacterium]|nr:hypothetical protein [Acidobacteriota bacterium]MBI3472926.1 hypothetical protein [Candidatus Solibacter usitatus]
MKFQISLLRLGDAVQHPAPVAVEEAKQLRELADLAPDGELLSSPNRTRISLSQQVEPRQADS